MDEKFQKLKKISGMVLRHAMRPFVIVAVLIIVALILIAGIKYVVDLDDAVNKPGNKKNVPNNVEQHTNNVTISLEGIITTEKTAQELWDEMIENDSRVKEYLDGPEELLKMMNAEAVTNYLDTRPDPSNPIDWEGINQKVNSKEVQGIVKLRRAFEDGTNSLITYVDSETFQAYIDQYNKTGLETDKKKVLSHFTLEGGQVNTGGAETNGGVLSTNKSLYAKVATWQEVTNVIESNDPTVETNGVTTRNMTTTKINYQQLVSEYKLPFDYLWALLVIGQEKEFVFDLADLVYNSEIEITIHDNLTKNTNVSVDTYTNMIKVVTDNVKVKVNYTDTNIDYAAWDTGEQNFNANSSVGTATQMGGPFEAERNEGTYTTTYKTITTTNTLDIKVTKANVWIADYSQEFKYQIPDTVPTISQSGPYSEEYKETPNKVDGNDGLGLGEKYRRQIQEQYATNHSTAIATIESLNSQYYYRKIDRTENITNTMESKKYVASPAKMIEKTDTQSEEPNFVTLLSKYKRCGENIKSVSNWLFEILEKGKNTNNMVDLTKYLLYKTTGTNYGITQVDFSVFEPRNFQPINYRAYGNTPEEKVWYSLREAGYSEEAVAGVMGNIYGESGFDPAIIERGNAIGFGLCQWSFDRRIQLENYAKLRDMLPSDIDTQIEFLLTELTPGASGPAQGYAKYQLLYYNGCNGSMWENASTPEEAALAFCWSFERPENPDIELRQQKAREYYEMFKGKTRPTGGAIIQIADAIHKYMESNNYTYCVYYTNTYEECGRFGKTCGLNNTFEESITGHHNTCCATYVSWVLQEAGYISKKEHTNSAGGMRDLLIRKGWIPIFNVSELEPGDVLYYNSGHVEIYAGDGTVYNAGSGNAIRSSSPATKTSIMSMTCGLRAPNY